MVGRCYLEYFPDVQNLMLKIKTTDEGANIMDDLPHPLHLFHLLSSQVLPSPETKPDDRRVEFRSSKTISAFSGATYAP